MGRPGNSGRPSYLREARRLSGRAAEPPSSKQCYNAPMAISIKFTHADLLVMPDDGKRREIVEGELFVTRSLAALLGNARILISWER